MKSKIVLVLLVTATLIACGKSEEAAVPATDAPQLTEPTPAEPVALEPAALEPTLPESAVAEPAQAVPAAAPAKKQAASSAPVQPAQPVAPKSAAAVAPTVPVAAPEAAPAAAPKPDLARGQQVYRQSCAVCHDKGIAGAPKTGDTAIWALRLARGMDAMYNTALNGKGAMPAKGGNPSLNDTDVKAAVDYMAAQSR